MFSGVCMALSDRKVKDDARSMRDLFIDFTAGAISELNHQLPRREAYLEGFAICRALDTLEDLETVLAMRWGQCRRCSGRGGNVDLQYLWTTEAISWVATYLGWMRSTALEDACISGWPVPEMRRYAFATRGWKAFKAAAVCVAAIAAGMGGGTLAAVLFG